VWGGASRKCGVKAVRWVCSSEKEGGGGEAGGTGVRKLKCITAGRRDAAAGQTWAKQLTRRKAAIANKNPREERSSNEG